MEFSAAVKSACSAALRDDLGQIDHKEWQLLYRRKESVSEFCRKARILGYDARDEGDGVIAVYDSAAPEYY